MQSPLNPTPAIPELNLDAQKIDTAGLLSAGFAHDFNNLLTVINGYGDLLLKSDDLSDHTRRCITAMRSAGERAAALAQAMMALSRRAPLERRLIDINDSVNETISLARQLLPPEIELSADLEPRLPLVRTDRNGILQVLLNLVVNSRDAMPDGGKLVISTAKASPQSLPNVAGGTYVELIVRDNGKGMDDETRRRIFEPFFTTKAPGAGTGLGLPMVQHMVQQSGGSLSIDSTAGEGTSVRISFPAAEGESNAEPAAGGDTMSAPVGGHETILVVEDSTDLRTLMRELLEGLGYSVLDAASSAEAVELSRGLKEHLHLLVVDVMLPDSSGIELAGCLREIRAGLPVLYVSGYLDGQNFGAVPDADSELLSKPFTMSMLAERVRSILDRKRPKRILFVDDDAQVVMFAAEVLREGGFEVLVGSDGNEALSIVQVEPLDLVITDLVMREKEGLETMMRLRKSNPDLPVIAISGAFGGHFLRSASMLGARATLPKPFSGEDLLSVVRKVLQG